MSSEPLHPETTVPSTKPSASEDKGKDVMTHAPTESEPIIDFKVWNPPKGSSRPQRGMLSMCVKSCVFTRYISDLPDSYFEPTANELKAIYHAQVKAREALANAPLKTQQIRERELQSKMERWPTVCVIKYRFIN